LALTEAEDLRALLYCHAGCTINEIVEAIDLTLAHLYPSPLARWSAAQNGRPAVIQTDRASVDADPGADDAFVPWISDLLKSTYTASPVGDTDPEVDRFAVALNLPPASLRAFGVRAQRGDLLIPEVEANGRLVGLLRRNWNGEKKAVFGSRRGLVVPFRLPLRSGDVYVAEGATDAFAFFAAGLPVIGRPAAREPRAAREWLARLIEKIAAPGVIVLGDRDRRPEGRWPGLEGATALADALKARLRCPVRWALPAPPFKDVREQFVAGAIGRGFCIEEAIP
jgi:hypothetical protein